MKKILFALFLVAVILLTVFSCSTSRDVRVTEKRDDNGVVIKKKKTITDDDDKNVRVKVRKDRRDRDRNLDEPAIIIKKDDNR